MDAKKISDERSEETRNVVDQPLDGERFPLITLPQVPFANFVIPVPPGFYVMKLREQISEDDRKDVSLAQFLQKASELDLVSPRQTPKEWLQKLTTVDFADPASIIDLRFDLVEDNVEDFDLVTNGEDTFTISSYPGALGMDDTPVLEHSDVHPGLLSLEFVNGSGTLPVSEHDETAKSSGVDRPLPSLVLPIGQLQKGYTTKSGISDSDDTNYVLVVDAVATAHPVWLIFNRNAGNLSEERGYINPATANLVFNGTEKNYDAAQVLPSIQDWLQSYGKLSFIQLLDSFRKTGMTGEVRARRVTAVDAAVLWNKDTAMVENK
jgi:hypothetical protein